MIKGDVRLERRTDGVGRCGKRDRQHCVVFYADAGPDRSIPRLDSHLSNVTLVERVLAQRAGIEVVAHHAGGRLGLALAREHQPVLALLDPRTCATWAARMVLQRLRDDRATGSIPAVVVSADATPGDVQRLLGAGASCLPHQTRRRA